MIGIVVEFVLSFLLLRYFGGQGWGVLGLSPSKKRFKEGGIGLLLPLSFTILLQLTLAALVGNPYRLNPHYGFGGFMGATYYVFKSIVFEELLFRGALLYILLQRLGVAKAVGISSISFGIYHWFSWNVFGNPVQMAVVACMTATAGFVFALAFARTRSMYLPLALHFGIDFAGMVLFSQDKNIGPQLLIRTFEKDPHAPGSLISLLYLIIYYTGFPIVCLIYLRSLRRRDK